VNEMEQEEGIAMMKALGEAMKEFAPSAVEDTRVDQQEKMLTRIMALTGQGTLVAYFASIQTMFLILKWTGVVSWSWWYIPIPMVILMVAWYAIHWSQRKQAERMINEMKRDINELKRHIQEDISA